VQNFFAPVSFLNQIPIHQADYKSAQDTLIYCIVAYDMFVGKNLSGKLHF
jgi:hypothetical protein